MNLSASDSGNNNECEDVARINGDPGNSTAARGLQCLRFVNKIGMREGGWAAVERRFDEHADGDLLPRAQFGHCIGINKEQERDYMVELYEALARRKGTGVAGTLTFNKSQLKEFWEQLTNESFRVRLQIFLRHLISLSASTNRLSEIHKRADEYSLFIMEALDHKGLGYLELRDLERVLLLDPEEASNIAAEIGKKPSQQVEPNTLKRWVKKLNYFVVDNWKRFWVILLWLCVCVALFTWKFFQYKRRYVFHVMGYSVCVAKGGAETTKLNMALILLPVCRNTITRLRGHTKLGRVLNFHDNINSHKVIATGIAGGIVLHVVPHMACDFPRLLHVSNAAYVPLMQYFGEEKPANYWWFMKSTEGWTGVVMVVLMVIAYILAIGYIVVRPLIRRKKLKAPTFVKTPTEWGAFWYSHHLFVVVYALFIVHGSKLYLEHTWYNKTTWMYVAVPVVLYARERLSRACRARYSRTVDILEAQPESKVLPGEVLALYMTKPNGFEYTSGQYILIKCPQISHLEWHPFSLTSAPGDESLGVHIRKAGKWTTQLLEHFSPSQHNGNGNHTPSKPKVEIEGPYGAPAQDYKNYDVLLLVGLGIGVTPFISIVKDVLRHQNLSDLQSGGGGGYAVKKAYFYWTAREPVCFEWFSEDMDDVAGHENSHMLQDHHVIEIHNHCTGVYEEGDARSALIAMLRSLHYAEKGVDFFSRSRILTRFGRPNWDDVLQIVASNHESQRIGVFYCGPKEVGKELKRLVRDFYIAPNPANFEFHMENF